MLHENLKTEKYKEKALRLLDILVDNTRTTCNSHYFTFLSLKHRTDKNTSDVICLVESIKSLLQAYKIFGREEYLREALSIVCKSHFIK